MVSVATKMAFAAEAPPAFSTSFSNATICAFNSSACFFKLAKDFCFASTVLSPPPQAVTRTSKLSVNNVANDFIVSKFYINCVFV